MPITNFDRWREYTSGLSSPDSYVDWSWLYVISACLQRRVWLGPSNQRCFPNIYVVLVGPPGVGKGLVLREVTGFLKHWRLKDVTTFTIGEDTQKINGDKLAPEDLRRMQENLQKKARENAMVLDTHLFPLSADAITYEALVTAIGESYAYVQYLDTNGKTQAYGHSSLGFTLQELASLLRKRTEDTVNLLLGMYDCPDDYEYRTLSRGKDFIRRGCLNIIAGTTPSFMQSTFDSKLTDEGLASRTFFIYATKNRKHQMWLPDLTPEQEEHKKHLLEHIRNLAPIYGPIELEQGTKEFLQEWWESVQKDTSKRSNRSPKMIPYYARKNIHVMKIAMAMHFSESVIRKVPLHRFVEAIDFLDKEEKSMHLALAIEGSNPENKAVRRILEALSTGEKNFVQICSEVWALLPSTKGITEQLEMLDTTGKITSYNKRDPDTDKNIVYYKIIPE